MDRAKCNTIFVNLLRFHGQEDTLSTAFIREFFETVRCDQVFDMSAHRDEYARKLTKPRLERIMAFKSTDEDEAVAAQATMHYHTWHEKQLLAAITWPSLAYYHTVTRAERTLAVLGITGATYGATSAALASFRYLRDARMLRRAQMKK
jgi:hypothetical protein